jgi:cyclophilin family peptidyl-prolyl cis-trans isomerase
MAESSPGDDAAKQLERATKIKEEATNLYKQEKWQEAFDKWLESLGAIPVGEEENLSRLRLSLHLNLAQVSLQMKNWAEVVKQATFAFELDQTSSKALFRRGIAQDQLGKVKQAVEDLRKAAHLDPRNGEIRKKFEECKEKALELQDDEDRPPVHDVPSLPRVFLDISVGSRAPVRLVFALYKDSAPKTAENFRQLCTGEHAGLSERGKPFHYKGSVLHRRISTLMIQGGDFESANGTGGESIYGRRFEDETFGDKHCRRGLLAMANDGPNTNGSNFFVLFSPQEHLDRHHVIFGELLRQDGGFEFLDTLEALATDAEQRPLEDCVITDCGELPKA